MQIDSVCRSGSLFLMCGNLWEVSAVSFSKDLVDVKVKNEDSHIQYVIDIYGQLRKHLCKFTWELLSKLVGIYINRAILIRREFNEIMCLAERSGGSEKSKSDMLNFVDVMDIYYLVDLGFVGHPFIWCK